MLIASYPAKQPHVMFQIGVNVNLFCILVRKYIRITRSYFEFSCFFFVEIYFIIPLTLSVCLSVPICFLYIIQWIKVILCLHEGVSKKCQYVWQSIPVFQVEHVINYEFPNFMSDYLHRAGRVGRVSSKNHGQVTSFVTYSWEVDLLWHIEVR